MKSSGGRELPPKYVFCKLLFYPGPKGSLSFQKWMNFRKISEREGGVIFDLKKFTAICFALEMAILVMNFWREKYFEKGGWSFPISKFSLHI